MILLLPNKTSHDCSLIVNKLYSNRMNGKQVMLGWVKLSLPLFIHPGKYLTRKLEYNIYLLGWYYLNFKTDNNPKLAIPFLF